MAQFDPFESEFRRKAAGLRRTPSARSWNRLERRLDRRTGGARLFGIRPWMIAALVLLMAGTFVITEAAQPERNVLAQRAETIQELSAPYVPQEAFQLKEYDGSSPAAVEQKAEFRDVTVAEAYRVRG